MIVREIAFQELEEAKQLYCDSFHKEPTPITIPFTGKIIGLYLESELIGIAQIDFLNNIFENKVIAHINSFCIKEEERHKGYGDFLLKECIKIAENNHADSIHMTSNKNRVYAHMLYQKNHFTPIDTILLKKDL